MILLNDDVENILMTPISSFSGNAICVRLLLCYYKNITSSQSSFVLFWKGIKYQFHENLHLRLCLKTKWGEMASKYNFSWQ